MDVSLFYGADGIVAFVVIENKHNTDAHRQLAQASRILDRESEAVEYFFRKVSADDGAARVNIKEVI